MIKKHDPAVFDFSLKVILKNKKGEALVLIAGSKFPKYRGLWDLPGGRINNDELGDPLPLLIDREIKEETGESTKYTLNPRPIAVGHAPWHGKVNKAFAIFEANYISGEIITSDEHKGFLWKKLTKNDIAQFLPIIHPALTDYFKNVTKKS